MFNPFFVTHDPEPILRDVFDGVDQGTALFYYIRMNWPSSIGEGSPPWANYSLDVNLDTAYFLNHSGSKFCSPLVKYFLNKGGIFIEEDGTLSSTSKVRIGSLISEKYAQNWNRLWETNVAVYSPIHNYDMYEERDLETTEDETATTDGTLSKSGTESTQYGRSESIAHGRTNEQMTYKYGLNTNPLDPKPSDKVNDEEGGTTTTTLSGNDTNTLNHTDTTDETRTKDNDGTEHEETHRYGNIGVTTSQKLLQEERQLWLWNYFDQIFSDIDKELALSVYDPCRV